jgi:hypothetical protein
VPVDHLTINRDTWRLPRAHRVTGPGLPHPCHGWYLVTIPFSVLLLFISILLFNFVIPSFASTVIRLIVTCLQTKATKRTNSIFVDIFCLFLASCCMIVIFSYQKMLAKGFVVLLGYIQCNKIKWNYEMNLSLFGFLYTYTGTITRYYIYIYIYCIYIIYRILYVVVTKKCIKYRTRTFNLLSRAVGLYIPYT